MSGATLASGPRIIAQGEGTPGGVRGRAQDVGGLGGVMGSLRVIELQLVAFIVVFSASGLVPIVDILFPIGISVYAYLMSEFIFPNFKGTDLQVFKGNRLFQLYVVSGTTIGLFLPLAYVLGGFARGDQQSVRAATPHLFLLSCQILSENVISGLQICSLPVRALIPILYNGRRLFAVADWAERMFVTTHLAKDANFNESAWFWFGRTLAAANALYYTINLFGFLVPMFLPRAFERYFDLRKVHVAEVEKKKAEEIERKSHLPDPAPPPGMHKKAH